MISTIYSLQLSWIWGKVGNYYNKIQHTTIINYCYDCPSPSFFSFWFSWFMTFGPFHMSGTMHDCLSLRIFAEVLIVDFHSELYVNCSLIVILKCLKLHISMWESLVTNGSANNCVYWNKTLAVTSQIWPQQHQT